MKLKNRIMSWLLSPGAYALWHSMGNPEEWMWDQENERFYNKSAQLYVRMRLWWTEGPPFPLLLIPPITIVALFLWAAWPFVWFTCYSYEDGIGWIDRNLIAGRAMRLRGKLMRRDYKSKKQKQNTAIFTKLTVNQVAE